MEALYSKEKIEDVYIMGEILGSGGSGSVTQLCTRIETGSRYACKCIPKLRKENCKSIAREAHALHALREHPNVVTLERIYETATHVYLVMELCEGGDLLQRINKHGFVSEAKARSLMHTIMGVVKTCHGAGVLHLDLKPENLMFGVAAELKCMDFGSAQFFEPGQAVATRDGMTPAYMAPEAWNGRCGPQADVWSAGVVLYMMLAGARPFSGAGTAIYKEVTSAAPPRFEGHPWPHVSEDAKDLIRKMLRYDPTTRPTASQVLQHPWMLQ